MVELHVHRLTARLMNVTVNLLNRFRVGGILIALLACAGGCGTTREKLATEQLLMSDAVDRAVASIDFRPLRGEKIYLDTTYVRQIKGTAFVNADYIISSLRQQMVLAGCLLQENREEADFIAEARVGVLGTDAHDVNYGLPGSQGISAAASLVAGGTPLPSFPEVSFARKTDDTAASKIAVFAYHRETREPIWQSGVAVARSSARANWILGAGPFQSGSIYTGTEFADTLRPSPLTGNPQEELTDSDNIYRNPAVWSPELQVKAARRLNWTDPESSPSDELMASTSESSDAESVSSASSQAQVPPDGASGEVQPAEYRGEVPEGEGTSTPPVATPE